MPYGNSFCPFRLQSSTGNLFNSLQNRRMIIPVTAQVAYTNGHVFKHNKASFMLKNFLFYQSFFNNTLTIFTFITVHNFFYNKPSKLYNTSSHKIYCEFIYITVSFYPLLFFSQDKPLSYPKNLYI